MQAGLSGYPDCRDDTMKYVQLTLSWAWTNSTVDTPLSGSTETDTWALAHEPGPDQPLVD
jgi:7-cyano-7-deazaguanine synthase